MSIINTVLWVFVILVIVVPLGATLWFIAGTFGGIPSSGKPYLNFLYDHCVKMSDIKIPCGTEEHLADFVRVALDNCREEIRIYAHSMGELDFFRYDCQESWKRLLSSRVSVRILICKEEIDSIRLEKLFYEYGVLVKVATGSYADGKAKQFITFDGRGYRFEFNKELRSAVCSFNGLNEVKVLNDAFDTAYKNGVPYNAKMGRLI